MAIVLRALVGIIGLLSAVTLFNLWFNTDATALSLGLTTNTPLSHATVRADVAGLFAGIGIFSLLAAYRQSADLAKVALILIVGALAGRVLNLLMVGMSPELMPPLVIELVIIVVLGGAVRLWSGSKF
jgi:hypothetical protein